jgi:putative effector of murein hydrolase
MSEVAGAFSGLGMGLNGVLTAILLPLIWKLL